MFDKVTYYDLHEMENCDSQLRDALISAISYRKQFSNEKIKK